MKFTQIVQEIVKTRQITPDLEQEINELLWSKEFDASEMDALKQLEKLLAEGSVMIG
ncbi:MAG: hypothetical protein SWY16_18160 [Cyanobacteriota bacterium]|nr:hypothetical protein [Cyanobacteriota bacterium]